MHDTTLPPSVTDVSVPPSCPPTPTAFKWSVRVYYEDTDAGGVVFHANYLKFFERARTEWLRAVGIGQQTLAQDHGIMLVVSRAAIDYHASAKLDDELSITVAVEKMGRASVHFLQHAWRAGDGEARFLATARVKVGCVSADTMRPVPLPEPILKRIAFP